MATNKRLVVVNSYTAIINNYIREFVLIASVFTIVSYSHSPTPANQRSEIQLLAQLLDWTVFCLILAVQIKSQTVERVLKLSGMVQGRLRVYLIEDHSLT